VGESRADLLAKTLEATFYYPNASTPYAMASFAPQAFVVGQGLETTGTVENLTRLVTDFDADKLTITFNTIANHPVWSTAAFNGVEFALSSSDSFDFVSALVDPATTLAGFDNSRISFTSGTLALNFSGLAYKDADRLVINFGFGGGGAGIAVPEPGVPASIAAGLLMAVVFLRRIQRRNALSLTGER